MMLQTGGTVFSGETPSVLGFGHTAFQTMTLVVNMKIIFVQRVRRLIKIGLSVGSQSLAVAGSTLEAQQSLVNMKIIFVQLVRPPRRALAKAKGAFFFLFSFPVGRQKKSPA